MFVFVLGCVYQQSGGQLCRDVFRKERNSRHFMLHILMITLAQDTFSSTMYYGWHLSSTTQHRTARLIEVNALGCLSRLQNIWYAIFRVSLTHTHFNFCFFCRFVCFHVVKTTFVWRHKIWWVRISLLLGQWSFMETVTVIFFLT